MFILSLIFLIFPNLLISVMRSGHVLFLWHIFLVYRVSIHLCKSADNLTSIDNFYNDTNQTFSKFEKLEVLTRFEYLICTQNVSSVDNITCSFRNQSSELFYFGVELLDSLPKQFPESFQAKEDVNITQEIEYLVAFIELHNNDELYDEDKDEIQNTDAKELLKEDDIINNMVNYFSKYLRRSGKRGLKNLAYKVKNLVNPTLYLNHILKVPKYLSELEKYFKFILRKKIRFEIDQQFIILDMLETSIKIFGKASEEICGVIVQESNITLSFDQINAIEEALRLAVFNEKKTVFKHVCQSTYVCRRFPAYSDYIAKLLKCILKLEQKYFDIVSNIIIDTIMVKLEFLKSVLGDQMATNVTLELESLADHSAEVRSLITVFVNIINQRYKVFYINGVEIRYSTKAARILIDIIDVTFQAHDENIVESDFQDLLKGIVEWGRGKKRDIVKLLSNFVIEAVDFLDFYWNRDIKEEVKILIQFMVIGASDNDTLRDRLFTKGSIVGTGDHVIYAEYEGNNEV